MTTNTIIAAQYAFDVGANPANDRAYAKALDGTGRVLIAKDHTLARWMHVCAHNK